MARGAFTLEMQGMDQVKAALQAAGRHALEALGIGMRDFAEAQIATRSKKEFVPVMTGALRTSIAVQPVSVVGKRITVTVGAGGAAAPYALAVHENPRAGHTMGVSPRGRPYKRWARVGQWKYLEQPAVEAAARGDLLAEEVRKVLEGLLHGAG